MKRTISVKEAVALRKAQKKSKPRFFRQNEGIISVRKGWRRPRGRHSKFRLNLRSYGATPKIGYSSPRVSRHLTREGFEQRVVTSPHQLTKDIKAVIISGTIGAKKRVAIIKKAEELGVKILNFTNPQAYVARVNTQLQQNKEKRTKKAKKKEELKKESEKKEKDAKEKTTEGNQEEKKKKEAEEKRKVLEQK